MVNLKFAKIQPSEIISSNIHDPRSAKYWLWNHNLRLNYCNQLRQDAKDAEWDFKCSLQQLSQYEQMWNWLCVWNWLFLMWLSKEITLHHFLFSNVFMAWFPVIYLSNEIILSSYSRMLTINLREGKLLIQFGKKKRKTNENSFRQVDHERYQSYHWLLSISAWTNNVFSYLLCKTCVQLSILISFSCIYELFVIIF